MSDSQTPTPELIARAQASFLNRVWADDAFRARLENDPRAVLQELGGELPPDVEVRVVCDTDKVKFLHIPSPPPEGEISDHDLLAAQGGTTVWCLTLSAAASAAVTITTVAITYETTKA
jgi:Nitrile hydratase, alpha chain